METKYKATLAIAVVAILAGSIFFMANPIQPANADTPADSGLSAAITFSDTNLGADILKPQGPLPSANLLEQLSVLDSQNNDLTNKQMKVQLKGKIIASGVPVKNWTITGSMNIKIDDKDFKTYPIAASGTQLGSGGVVIIKISNADSLSVPVTDLRNAWGQYSYGNHNIVLRATGTLKIGFVDNVIRTKTITDAKVGSVTLINRSDATASFEIVSNYDNSGTTTGGSLLVDNWASGSLINAPVFSTRASGMLIQDTARRGLEIHHISIPMAKSANATIGTVYINVYKAGDNTLIATSKERLSVPQLSGSLTTYKFTFDGHPMTPANDDFYFVVVNEGGDGKGMILKADNVNNPYQKGSLYHRFTQTSGGYTYLQPQTPTDLVGSISYVTTSTAPGA